MEYPFGQFRFAHCPTGYPLSACWGAPQTWVEGFTNAYTPILEIELFLQPESLLTL